ncbi:hypothetical protein B0J11DRAFT_244371 [Dendryphion nanum]|uniref:Uncharacterized protein n=1 Tax=Dendryphion nanum TaxID=256645 RepID=A0A9P9E3L7_9PLEO|nr:hypothetical protein B0J11DRAFT_244371 [Dendryphion nanum]
MDSWFRNVGCGVAEAGRIIHGSLDGFGRNAGNALDSWGKEMGKDLDPSHPVHIAMVKTGQFSFAVARETLRSLDGFGQQTERSVSKAYNEVHRHVSTIEWDGLSNEVRAWVEHNATELGVAVSDAVGNVLQIAQSDLPAEITQWIAENPGQTIFIIAAGAVFFAPFLMRVPLLKSLGFATHGVAAGSAAAAIQSMIGPLQTGSIFSLLQSAGAGGSSLTVVDAMISTGAGVGLSTLTAKSALG